MVENVSASRTMASGACHRSGWFSFLSRRAESSPSKSFIILIILDPPAPCHLDLAIAICERRQLPWI